ncbi:MAG: EAL domain-containing protein, partial [Faecousia sp.]
MQPNIWFNVCALCVLVVLVGLYYIKFKAPFKKYVIFLDMAWMALVSTVASLCNNTLPGLVPLWVLQLSNMTYFLAHGLLLPALLLYVHSLTDHSLAGWKRLIPWLIPTAFSMLLILTSWYSDSLFWLDEGGNYHRGSMMWLVYLVTGYNIVGIVIHLVQRWHRIPRREGALIVVFLALSSGAVLLQMFCPWLLVENFASALCIMMSQLAIQSPELIMDGSTGMLNKQGFSNLLLAMFDQHHSFQVGFLMVDNYHELEKIYGYTRLESRICVLSNFLKQHPGAIYARVDSGLFCFVPENLQNPQAWTDLLQDLDADTLISCLHKRRIGVRVQMKMGVVDCPQEAESFTTLMGLFDMAARLPIAKGQDAFRLSSVDVMNLRRRKLIEEQVRSAVKDNSLRMVYQPIYDIRSKRFCSAEALMRMHTEKTGDVSPGEFIRIAEDSGAILKLTRFAVETVCRFLRSADLKGLDLRWVNINLSAIDCAQEDLAERMLGIIRGSGVEPGMISAEVTETAFTNLPDSVLSNLTDLSRAGVTIMLDD